MERRLEKLLCLGGFAAWTANALVRWISSTPLMHDEAQYALDARDLLQGEASRWIYTSPGMQAIAVPGVIAGGDERALRLLPVLLGIGFLIAAWYTARRWFGATTAAWTVAVLGSAPQLLRASASLLSDLPSTACLLAAVAVIFSELAREDGPRRRLLFVAPLCAAAFYVRYGSCVPIAIIAVATLAFGARAIVRHPRLPLLTAGALVLLLVPHAISAMRATGSPLGVILLSAGVPRPGDGVIGYLADPLVAYGWLVAPVMLIGAVVIQRNRTSLAMQVIAIAHIVALGVLTHAQPRYVFFGTVLLVIRGVDVVRAFAPRLGRLRNAGVAAALVAVSAMWIFSLYKTVRYGAIPGERIAPTMIATAAIRDDARGAACQVMGRHQTQLEWYSGCAGALVVPHEAIAAGKHVYAVWDNSGGPSQPVLDSLPGTYVMQVPGVVAVRRLSP
jgi:hypothetical protein